MNFSGISNAKPLGKILRAPLRFVPKDAEVPILQGKLRGKRWIVGSSNHGCWLGSYEYEKRRRFEQTITPGSVVFDIGAHVGFYTLLAADLVGPAGRVVAFEPVSRNLTYLRRHLRQNGFSHVTVIDRAVCDRTGVARFEEGPGSCKLMGRLSPTGEFWVNTVSLDEKVSCGELPPPDFIKIDVEGAELLVLWGATTVLSRARPKLFLSTHGAELHRECCEFLHALGYTTRRIGGKTDGVLEEVLAEPS